MRISDIPAYLIFSSSITQSRLKTSSIWRGRWRLCRIRSSKYRNHWWNRWTRSDWRPPAASYLWKSPASSTTTTPASAVYTVSPCAQTTSTKAHTSIRPTDVYRYIYGIEMWLNILRLQSYFPVWLHHYVHYYYWDCQKQHHQVVLLPCW